MVALTRTEDDWQQQADELIALAAILQGDFNLIAGPDVTGDTEQDTTALLEHDCCCEQLQCTVTVRADLPSDGIDVKVCAILEMPVTHAGEADVLRLIMNCVHGRPFLLTSTGCFPLRWLANQSLMEQAGAFST